MESATEIATTKGGTYFVRARANVSVARMQEAYDNGVAGFFQMVSPGEWELAREFSEDCEVVSGALTPQAAVAQVEHEFRANGIDLTVDGTPYIAPVTKEMQASYGLPRLST